MIRAFSWGLGGRLIVMLSVLLLNMVAFSFSSTSAFAYVECSSMYEKYVQPSENRPLSVSPLASGSIFVTMIAMYDSHTKEFCGMKAAAKLHLDPPLPGKTNCLLNSSLRVRLLERQPWVGVVVREARQSLGCAKTGGADFWAVTSVKDEEKFCGWAVVDLTTPKQRYLNYQDTESACVGILK